jgi:flagellar hook assembly protein FlgD
VQQRSPVRQRILTSSHSAVLQDPTAPTDPTEFVGQLVQFNSLEQLIQINQNLQTALPTDSSSSSSNQNSTQSAVQNFAAQNQTSQLNVVA